MTVRKTIFYKEVITTDETGEPCAPITRVAAMAVISNPYAGQFHDDLGELFEISANLGATLAAELVELLPSSARTYGKAAIVGTAGAMEHGAAVLHPRLGAPVRSAIGGGKSLMPSNHKLGDLGARIDLPLGHKDDPWSFDFIDTLTLSVADAPKADEIVLCLGMSDGPRANPRVGSGPST